MCAPRGAATIRPMPAHRSRFRVRYGETDQMGVVHHSAYLLYFEEGRTDMLRSIGRSYAALERDGVILPVVEAGLRFRTPLRYDEEIIVETRITHVGGARVRFDYRVLHGADGTLAAEGFTMLASIDGEGRPRRLPDDLAPALRGCVEEEGAGGVQGA